MWWRPAPVIFSFLHPAASALHCQCNYCKQESSEMHPALNSLCSALPFVSLWSGFRWRAAGSRKKLLRAVPPIKKAQAHFSWWQMVDKMFDLFWKVEGERNMSAFADFALNFEALSVIWCCSEATLFHTFAVNASRTTSQSISQHSGPFTTSKTGICHPKWVHDSVAALCSWKSDVWVNMYLVLCCGDESGLSKSYLEQMSWLTKSFNCTLKYLKAPPLQGNHILILPLLPILRVFLNHYTTRPLI